MFGKQDKPETDMTEEKKAPGKSSFLGRFLIFLTLLAFLLGGGFLYFISLIPTSEPQDTKIKADGIVVLTGGAGRIQKAVWLISTTEAKRLLISGVNSATKTGEITELKNISSSFIECCIELDYQARNTIENASETSLWAKKHDIKTLILVTSNYHMPRSFREMALASPDLTFIPYPVIDKKVQIKNWWEFPGTRRLLMGEYFKYILAMGRIGLVKIGVQSSVFKTERPQ